MYWDKDPSFELPWQHIKDTLIRISSTCSIKTNPDVGSTTDLYLSSLQASFCPKSCLPLSRDTQQCPRSPWAEIREPLALSHLCLNAQCSIRASERCATTPFPAKVSATFHAVAYLPKSTPFTLLQSLARRQQCFLRTFSCQAPGLVHDRERYCWPRRAEICQWALFFSLTSHQGRFLRRQSWLPGITAVVRVLLWFSAPAQMRLGWSGVGVCPDFFNRCPPSGVGQYDSRSTNTKWGQQQREDQPTAGSQVPSSLTMNATWRAARACSISVSL